MYDVIKMGKREKRKNKNKNKNKNTQHQVFKQIQIPQKIGGHS